MTGEAGPRLADVGERHRFDEGRLAAWLKPRIEGFDGVLQVRHERPLSPLISVTPRSARAHRRALATKGPSGG